MRKYIPYFIPLVLVSLSAIAEAQQRPDAADRAKVVAPLIDELTIAVVHVDLARIQSKPLLKKVAGWIPELESQLKPMLSVLVAPVEALKAAGATDAYVIVSLAGPPDPNDFLLFVVPLVDSSKEQAITLVLRQFLPDDAFLVKRLNDTVVAGTSDTLARLRDVTPDERPELAAAFEAVGDSAGQAVFLLPKHTRRVMAEIMPELPEAVGGGPSSILTDGIQWAAVGVDLGPQPAISAVIQSRDNDSAGKLLAKWGDLRQWLVKTEDVTREIPDFDRLAKLLTPEVRDSRLILQFDETSEAFTAVLKAIRADLAN